MRFAALCVLLAAIFTQAAPVSAHGPMLTGQILNHPTTVVGTTGTCSCLDRWFTAGFRPGHVTIQASLDKCSARTYKVCTLSVYVLSGQPMMMVKQLVLRCPSKRCGEAGKISLTVHQKRVYHVMVHGDGASTILFVMRVNGAMYHLRCGSSC
ncbi:MAG TPA: hypothetical protein VFB58_00025 [Chloroflexota bacterium]|nr:hypothetical protein [Chloroflexota bacterium]